MGSEGPNGEGGDVVASVQLVSDVINVLDLSGVFANALLGGAVARAHRLDPVGFAVLAITSALGGGLLRDVLLQSGTPVALADPRYLTTALVGAAIAFMVRFEGRAWDRLFPYIDALALGTWAAVGAQKALNAGLGWLPAMLLGVVTAVGGGAVRDIALREVPTILGGNTLYATCALVGSAVVVLPIWAGRSEWGMLCATGVGALMCLAARWRGWMLPEEITWRRPPSLRWPPRRRGR